MVRNKAVLKWLLVGRRGKGFYGRGTGVATPRIRGFLTGQNG